jgi:hypothetical protein
VYLDLAQGAGGRGLHVTPGELADWPPWAIEGLKAWFIRYDQAEARH